MDASYDEIPLHVQVPVRVFSARCNSIMAIIFFDFFGKPAQITIPAERQPTMGSGYEVLRELLYALARSLEPKGNYYMAARYIPVASQMEEVLRDFMLDAMPPPAAAAGASASPVDWLGQFPLEWFLSVGRQQFLLTEDVHGKVCAMWEATWPPEGLPPPMAPTKEGLPVIPRELPSVSTAHLKVLPARCGRNRVRGTTSLDLSGHGIGLARPYTFACMRELGARAASEGCHRAMAFQIQQLDRIAQACHGLNNEARQRRDMCVPDIRAVLYHDLATTGGGGGGGGGGLGLTPPGRLPVGVLFDELPQVLPLRAAAAPPDVYKDCVLKICKTVEWLMDVGIGWGGSVGADHKGNALLDAIVVDALCRPWLIEGFTEAKEGKVLSDRISVHMLRMEFGPMGVEQSL